MDIASVSALVTAAGVIVGVVLAILNTVGWAFEGLGFLLHRKFPDIDTVRELMSESTKMTWERVKPMAEDVRKQLSQRKLGGYVPLYQWWEYLYNELQKREQGLQKTQQ
ncbi:MAG: hypothetical protein JSV64_04895 [Candidatus Bathyarchaeota archaeon]|nr:MAG: hypothetical protein JSV64_04895 [Candidatus Bathyarchaeota archaeon]